MNGKEKEFYDIVFKNCTEKEIYAILFKKKDKLGQDFMGPLQVWPMVKSTRRYIGTALRGALYSLSYLLFVVCM